MGGALALCPAHFLGGGPFWPPIRPIFWPFPLLIYRSPMAVVIRLKRTGRRNRACYRISVADSRAPRDGLVLEHLGLYDPVHPDKENQSTLNIERARHWLEQGAQPSETVRSLFKRHGVFEDWGKPRRIRKRPGRKKVTATSTTRNSSKSARLAAKGVRRDERLTARRSAAKAEAAAEAAEAAE